MKFHRIYIELTNVCGLSCSFCPTKALPSLQMPLDFFESIVVEVKAYTREIACHVVGDPMTLSNLGSYLDILHVYGMKAVLTTSGYFLKKQPYETLFHPSVKQINISLNAFNKNDTSWTFEQYIAPVLSLCEAKLKEQRDMFINLRVWNLDETMSERAFNAMLFARLSDAFGTELDADAIYAQRPRSIRLASKVLLHFDSYFEWPSLNNPIYGDGTCQGLSSHIAILSNGKVVPCCLDCDGVVELGDLHVQSLDTILQGKRAQMMIHGFKERKAVEEFCQKCSYKMRFK